MVIIAVYVDDLLALGNDESLITEFKNEFMQLIKYKDYGNIGRFLGLNVIYDRLNRMMEISNIDYIIDLLKEASFEKCKDINVPMKLIDDKKMTTEQENCPVDVRYYQKMVGKLIYLTNLYRLDIACTVGVLYQSMYKPKKHHMNLLNNLLRYLQKTKNYKLKYSSKSIGTTIYADSSFHTEPKFESKVNFSVPRN